MVLHLHTRLIQYIIFRQCLKEFVMHVTINRWNDFCTHITATEDGVIVNCWWYTILGKWWVQFSPTNWFSNIEMCCYSEDALMFCHAYFCRGASTWNVISIAYYINNAYAAYYITMKVMTKKILSLKPLFRRKSNDEVKLKQNTWLSLLR